jgi:DedD protein
MVRNNESVLGIQQAPVANANQETNFYISGEMPIGITMERSGEEPVSRVVVDIPRPSSAAVPDTPVESRPVSRPAATAPAAAPAQRPAASSPAATTRPAASNAAAAPAQKKINDYWVQTGAFTAKVRAEGVKETLASKGITSVIENRDMDGKTWYRVRVGPYTSETEANYWLALVKSIDGFAESQVRITAR